VTVAQRVRRQAPAVVPVRIRARDIVRRYRDLGGNLAFLSANSLYARVELRGQRMTYLGHFRDFGRPEASVIGVQYLDWYQRKYASKPYVVRDASAAPWLFRGTGLKNGDRFGFTYGVEIDATTSQSPPDRACFGLDEHPARWAVTRERNAPGRNRRRARWAIHGRCSENHRFLSIRSVTPDCGDSKLNAPEANTFGAACRFVVRHLSCLRRAEDPAKIGDHTRTRQDTERGR
jgi:hypothetical protein